jgi:hypothetical protein
MYVVRLKSFDGILNFRSFRSRRLALLLRIWIFEESRNPAPDIPTVPLVTAKGMLLVTPQSGTGQIK